MCGQCEVKCMHHWMEDKLFCVFTPQVTGVCPPPRQLEWITYPIFSAPAAHRPLLGPWQWSHVGGERREGKEERRGERTSGAASHKKIKKRAHRIDFRLSTKLQFAPLAPLPNARVKPVTSPLRRRENRHTKKSWMVFLFSPGKKPSNHF